MGGVLASDQNAAMEAVYIGHHQPRNENDGRGEMVTGLFGSVDIEKGSPPESSTEKNGPSSLIPILAVPTLTGTSQPEGHHMIMSEGMYCISCL